MRRFIKNIKKTVIKKYLKENRLKDKGRRYELTIMLYKIKQLENKQAPRTLTKCMPPPQNSHSRRYLLASYSVSISYFTIHFIYDYYYTITY